MSSRLNSNGFSVEIIFHIRYPSVSNFLICIYKIMCKHMENFPENLNLGKCVPPLYRPGQFPISTIFLKLT